MGRPSGWSLASDVGTQPLTRDQRRRRRGQGASQAPAGRLRATAKTARSTTATVAATATSRRRAAAGGRRASAGRATASPEQHEDAGCDATKQQVARRRRGDVAVGQVVDRAQATAARAVGAGQQEPGAVAPAARARAGRAGAARRWRRGRHRRASERTAHPACPRLGGLGHRGRGERHLVSSCRAASAPKPIRPSRGRRCRRRGRRRRRPRTTATTSRTRPRPADHETDEDDAHAGPGGGGVAVMRAHAAFLLGDVLLRDARASHILASQHRVRRSGRAPRRGRATGRGRSAQPSRRPHRRCPSALPARRSGGSSRATRLPGAPRPRRRPPSRPRRPRRRTARPSCDDAVPARAEHVTRGGRAAARREPTTTSGCPDRGAQAEHGDDPTPGATQHEHAAPARRARRGRAAAPGARRRCPSPPRTASPGTRPSRVAQVWPAATAARAAPASPATTVRHERRRVARIRRVDGPPRSARRRSRPSSKQVRAPVWQAGPSWSTFTSRVSPSQSSRTSLDPLPVARGLALDPVLLPGAAPERRPPGGQRAVQRLVVHPADHEHLAGVVLLDDGRHEALAVALEARGDGGVEVERHACRSSGSHRPARTARAGRPTRRAAARRHRPRATRSACRPCCTIRPRSTTSDEVGTLGGGHPVRDRDRRAPAGQPVERGGDAHLERRVDGAGGLVEHEQVGVGQLRPHQRHELALPGRQRLAALADPGVEARPAARPASRRDRDRSRRRAWSSSSASRRP